MNKKQFLEKVRTRAALTDLGDAEEATKAVIHTLKRRITKEEARDAESQLSQGEKQLWEEELENLPSLYNIRTTRPGGVLKMHKSDFMLAVNEHSRYKYNPEAITRAVFSAMKDQITDGEAEDIASQLPKDIKRDWTEA